MTTFEIRKADPGAAEALLRASHALMEALFDPEENHFLSLDALRGPDIRFVVAQAADAGVIGCGAVALRAGYGELKSMFTAEGARGRGVAGALIDRLEEVARAEGMPLLRLETGDALHAARRLYSAKGFVERGPFGDYTANKTSIFMEKAIV